MADSAGKASQAEARAGGTRMPAGRTAVGRYGLAIAAIALVLAARALLAPILHDEAPYLFFVPAILVAAGVGGFGPGLLATVLGLMLGSLFVASFPSLSP